MKFCSAAAATALLLASAAAYTPSAGPLSRRALAKTASAAAAAAAALAASPKVSGAAELPAPYSLPALPYAYDALEPVIDKATMEYHHDKHHAKYVALTNQYFGRTPVDLTDIMTNTNTFYNKVPQTHTGAGGHYNHCFFWQCMGPVAEASKTRPSPALQKAIDKQFGSTDGMKAEFKQAALDRFGAGWAWLAVNYDAFTGKSELLVTSSPNQDNPLMLGSNSFATIAAEKDGEAGIPILGLDVWEHAYYLQYNAKRANYVDAWWGVVDWEKISAHYESAANGLPVKVGGLNPDYLAAGGKVVRV